jgi:hypothetical protein
MDLIIYHKSCPDGWCAAFIAHKRYPEAQLLARDHGLEPPYEEVTGKDVLVVDFSWRTREQNIKMAQLAKSFRILDHHKTAQAVLEGLDFAIFDMNRSGAGLAWDYLFGKDKLVGNIPIGTVPRPWWVDYVEDRDLWNKKLLSTDEANAYIMTLPFELEAWEKLARTSLETAISNGRGALAHVEHYVREGRKQAQLGILVFTPGRRPEEPGELGHIYHIKIVNALYMNISELAGALAQEPGIDIGIGYFERGDGIMQFSLRSRSDVDVSAIASSLGGGGHKNAAGFQLPLTQGRAFVDRILGRHLVSTLGNPSDLIPAYKS